MPTLHKVDPLLPEQFGLGHGFEPDPEVVQRDPAAERVEGVDESR